MPRPRASVIPPTPPIWSRSPSEYYVKYVLSDPHRTEMSIEDLARQLRDMGIILPPRDVDYLKKIELDLEERSPDPFEPGNLRHGPSQMFLQMERIWSMWHPDGVVEDAVRIFSTPNVREHVNALLVGDFNAYSITSLLGKYRSFVCLEAAIETYRHYFWNTALLTVEEQERVYADAKSGPVVMQSHLAGKSIMGRTTTLRRLGYQPDTPPSRAVFEQVIDEAGENLARIEEIPIHRRAQHLLAIAQSAFIGLRGVNETQAGASVTMPDLAKQLHISRNRTEPSRASEIGTARFVPKGLPGRGDLVVIDMEEKRADRTGSGGSEKSS